MKSLVELGFVEDARCRHDFLAPAAHQIQRYQGRDSQDYLLELC